MKIKAGILDDELIARNRVKSILETFSQVEIVINTSEVSEVLAYVEINHLDILFLDMNMPEINGLEFLEQLATLDS